VYGRCGWYVVFVGNKKLCNIQLQPEYLLPVSMSLDSLYWNCFYLYFFNWLVNRIPNFCTNKFDIELSIIRSHSRNWKRRFTCKSNIIFMYFINFNKKVLNTYVYLQCLLLFVTGIPFCIYIAFKHIELYSYFKKGVLCIMYTTS
jgi:hypothetical protein